MARTSWHERLFRTLLQLFPAEFRGDFGNAMSADFQDQLRDAGHRSGRVRRLWFRTSLDLLARAPKEHLDVIARDAVYALRRLRRHPVSFITAIASLAVGIGVSAAVYSVVGGVLWRSLPLADEDRLVSIVASAPGSAEPEAVLPATALLRLEGATTLERVAGGAFRRITIVEPGEPAHVSCLGVSPGFFDVLGVRPAFGRVLRQEDYDAALASHAAASERSVGPSGPTAVLGHGLWRRQFGGDPTVVGQRFSVAGGEQVTVVGVMGPELDELGSVMPGQCWFAQMPVPAHGRWMPYFTFGRIATGRSLTEVNAELAVIGGGLDNAAATGEPQTLRATPLLERAVARVRTQLLFLFAAVVCVLLVTCANVVNLFLAHAAGRRDELSTRVALGASRARLVRQALTESMVVSLLGGALGLLLVLWGVPLLVSLAPADLPRRAQIGVDWSTFGFVLGASVAIGLACGLLASLSVRYAPRKLFGAAHAATAPGTLRVRRAVTVGEVALALMLTVAAGFMVGTVRALNAVDLGFVEPRHIVSAGLEPEGGDWAGTQDLHLSILERVRELPGVVAAGIGVGRCPAECSLAGRSCLAIRGGSIAFASMP